MTVREAIKSYVAMGWSIIPIKPGTKQPAIPSWDEYAIARADLDQWRVWWSELSGDMGVAVVYSGCNVGMGLQLVCVDTDSTEEEKWVRAQGVPPTPTVGTASGFHRYFLAPAGLKHFSGKEGTPWPEVRAGEHYTVLPPSVHPIGLEYEWLDGLALGEVEIAALPEWGVELMRGTDPVATPREPAEPVAPKTAEERRREYGKSALGRELSDLSSAMQGGRNDQLNRAAYNLGQLVSGGVLDEHEVRQALLGACHANGLVKDDGLRAVQTTLESGLSSGKETPRTAPERPQRQERSQATGTATQPEPPALPGKDPNGLAIYEQQIAGAVNTLAGTVRGVLPSAAKTLGEIGPDIAGKMEDYRARDRVVRGLRSGFAPLDEHYLGYGQHAVVLVAGPSGYGKTTFCRMAMFATALHALQHGTDEHVVAFLLEDTDMGLLSSYMGFRGIPERLREPGSEQYMTPEWEAIMASVYAEFYALPITLETRKRLDISDIERITREACQKYNVVGSIVDHAQHIPVRGCTDKFKVIDLVGERIDALATELHVPHMLLSQVTTRDGEVKPYGSDKLRQMADVVHIITRGDKAMKREAAVQSNVMRVICDKSRWRPAHKMLVLVGDRETGRLVERDVHANDEPEQRDQWNNE
jgi:hypothetical protein